MPTSTRIKGDKELVLSFGATDYTCDAGRIELKSEEADADYTTFCDAAAGGARQWFFEVEAVQSTEATSFWRYLWESTGDTVAFIYKPHGNATPTDDEPHFTGSIKVGPKPDLGGEAGETFTFETRLDLTSEPLMVTE